MNDYEAKQERRRERLEAAAARAASGSDAAFKAARAATDGIPFGQPILVGHHSERRHRNAIKRSDNAMRRGCDEAKRARELASRAAGVGKGGVSSDDPDAVVKLREKLAALEAKRERIKGINGAWRKAGKPAADNPAGWQKAADALGVDLEALGAARIGQARDFADRGPYPPYVLQNLGSEVRRVAERIGALEAAEVAEDREPIVGPTFRVDEDRTENRACFTFDTKPAREVCALMRSEGWRWNRGLVAWTRMNNNAAWHSARYIAEKLEGGAA